VDRFEVGRAGVQLHTAAQLPERLHRVECSRVDGILLDFAQLPAAARARLQQRLRSDLSSCLVWQLLERPDLRPELPEAQLCSRVFGDHGTDLQRWPVGGAGVRARIPRADLPARHYRTRSGDLGQHHQQLEPAKLHDRDAATCSDVPLWLHDAGGSRLEWIILV